MLKGIEGSETRKGLEPRVCLWLLGQERSPELRRPGAERSRSGDRLSAGAHSSVLDHPYWRPCTEMLKPSPVQSSSLRGDPLASSRLSHKLASGHKLQSTEKQGEAKHKTKKSDISPQSQLEATGFIHDRAHLRPAPDRAAPGPGSGAPSPATFLQCLHADGSSCPPSPRVPAARRSHLSGDKVLGISQPES